MSLRQLLFRQFSTSYRFNQWLRRRFSPTGRFLIVGMLLAGLFGTNLQYSWNYELCALAIALLLCALTGSLWQRPRLAIQRQLPRYCVLEEPLSYPLQIQNLGTRELRQMDIIDEPAEYFPGYAELRKALEKGTTGTNRFDRWLGYPEWLALLRRKRGISIESAELRQALPPGGKITLPIKLIPRRRGWLHLRQIRYLQPEALGICNSQHSLSTPASLLCLPRRYPMPALRLGGPGNRRAQAARHARAGHSTDFLYLRDYRPGDPARYIHWPSYARSEELTVREFVRREDYQQCLFLDTSPALQSDQEADRERFEAAISVAASLAAPVQAQSGPSPSLLIAGGKLQVEAPWTSTTTAMSMLEALACLEPTPELGFAHSAALIRQHQGRLQSLIGIFPCWDPARQEVCNELLNNGCKLLIIIVSKEGKIEGAGLPPGLACLHVHPQHLQRDLAKAQGLQEGFPV